MYSDSITRAASVRALQRSSLIHLQCSTAGHLISGTLEPACMMKCGGTWQMGSDFQAVSTVRAK